MSAGPVRAFKLVQAVDIQKTLISPVLSLFTEVAVWLPSCGVFGLVDPRSHGLTANVGLSTVSHANSQAA